MEWSSSSSSHCHSNMSLINGVSLFRLSVEEPLEEEVSDSDWLIQDPVGEVSEEVFMSLINGVSLFLLSVEETLEEEIFDLC